MPDILIRGMEMPHNCFLCPLSFLKGERLFCHITTEEVLRAKIAPECPIHGLPPHGDLISRTDALAFPIANGKYDHENANKHFIFGCETYKEYLEQLPAIVPADKEETE